MLAVDLLKRLSAWHFQSFDRGFIDLTLILCRCIHSSSDNMQIYLVIKTIDFIISTVKGANCFAMLYIDFFASKIKTFGKVHSKFPPSRCFCIAIPTWACPSFEFDKNVNQAIFNKSFLSGHKWFHFNLHVIYSSSFWHIIVFYDKSRRVALSRTPSLWNLMHLLSKKCFNSQCIQVQS